MKSQKEIIEKIVESIKTEPSSFMELCRQTGFCYRTVRRQLEIIDYLQSDMNKVEIARNGFRVLIKKTHRAPTFSP